MKKLLLSLFAVLVLAGCGSGKSDSKKEETKTCTIAQSGITIDVKMDATDDVIKNLKMSVLYPESFTKGQDLSKVTDEQLKQAGDTAIKAMGITGKGVEAKFSIKDNKLAGDITFDLANGDSAALKKFGITGNAKNIKLADTVKDLEKSGATCK